MIIFNFKDKFSYSHLLEVLKENDPNIAGLDIRGNFTPKQFIDNMMSPNIKAQDVTDKYISYTKVESLEDMVVNDRIASCYDICKISFSSGNKKLAMFEGMVYSGLSEVTAEDVMHLMGHESIVV